MEEKKKSYEELENILSQLSAQNEALKGRLNSLNYSNAFTRLDFLLRVLSNPTPFPQEFVQKCADEVVAMMTIPEENTNEEAR